MKKPNEHILFKVTEECRASNIGELFEQINNVKRNFNELLQMFYKQHPNVIRTIEQLENEHISFCTYYNDYGQECVFEASMWCENANYAEELKKYNAKLQEYREQTDQKKLEKKAKRAALSELNKVLKNVNADKIEEIVKSLNGTKDE